MTPPSAGTASLTVELGGVRIALSSDFAPFLAYAAEHLAPLRAEAGPLPEIEARLRWHEGAPPPRDADASLAAMQRVDRDLYLDAHRLAWFRIDDCRDLHLRVAWDGRRLQVQGDYYHRLSRTAGRDRVKRVLYRSALPQRRQQRFTTLLYYLVYYPCFWWLERLQGWHPIHAGGVEIDGGVIVLAGPSGVGKSTLVTGLATAPGAEMLSDTFLLHRGAALRAVPEPLLLDRWSLRWLGDPSDRLALIRHRYCLGRDGYHWRSAGSAGGLLRTLVFPHRAPQPFVRPVGADEARGRVRAGDLIVNDLRRYWAFAAVLELLDPHPLVSAREASLAALVAAAPAFEVGITMDVTREGMIDTLRRLAADPGAAQPLPPTPFP